MSVTLVKNPEENWDKMAGDTDQIKKLNGILTSRAVDIGEAPNDECLTEAHIIYAVINMHSRAVVNSVLSTYLHTQFGWTPSEPVDIDAWVELIEKCVQVVKGDTSDDGA